MKRDGISSEEAALRMSAQYDEQFFIDYCDDILYNNTTEQELRGCVQRLYERLVHG